MGKCGGQVGEESTIGTRCCGSAPRGGQGGRRPGPWRLRPFGACREKNVVLKRIAKKVEQGSEMMVIGYAQMSSIGPDLSMQKHALRAAGCSVIRAERSSGTTLASQKQLQAVLEFLHHGDVLIVTRLEKLARSIVDLQNIVRTIRAKGAVLKTTEQPIDTSSVAGTAFLDMLSMFAEFESNLRKERQLEGIARAKAEGRYKGRPASVDVAKVRELKAQGKGATDIAREMRIGRASVYRALREAA